MYTFADQGLVFPIDNSSRNIAANNLSWPCELKHDVLPIGGILSRCLDLDINLMSAGMTDLH
jgi:hypothetical protein